MRARPRDFGAELILMAKDTRSLTYFLPGYYILVGTRDLKERTTAVTEDQNDVAFCAFIERLGLAITSAAAAWELRCKAAAARDDAYREGFEKAVIALEAFGPMVTEAIGAKLRERPS